MYYKMSMWKNLFWQSPCRTKTLWYTILVETTCACITMTSLFTDFRKGNLTYRAWLPYDYYSSTIVFCLTYAHQLISLTAGSLVNVACDSLICGLLVHLCCQIEILECRLSKVSSNHGIIRDCVQHHDGIFALVVLFVICWKYFLHSLKEEKVICIVFFVHFTYSYSLQFNLDNFNAPANVFILIFLSSYFCCSEICLTCHL